MFSDTLPARYHQLLAPTLEQLSAEGVIDRLWKKDHQLWKPEPTEIANRLGWLDLPTDMRAKLEPLRSCTKAARANAIEDVVLLGMGGSSLGPEVLRAAFGRTKGHPRLWVLDSTVPGWVRKVTEAIDPAKTLFLIASKSGGTIEVMSLFAHFWQLVGKAKGNRAGAQFIAITDPGTGLEQLAKERGFSQTFSNPPDIGGRYSVLSYFGLVPAALAGIDVGRLLERAAAMADRCRNHAPAHNPGAYLGAAMATLAKHGRDKVTVIASPAISSFGLWAEQLLAESTGKEGTGLIPVAQEPILPGDAYGSDRLFVYLRLKNDSDPRLERKVRALARSQHPVLQFQLRDRFDLGAEFFRWEFATALAGHLLKIHPFDQPNVQESKDNTNRVLGAFQSVGHLPDQEWTHPQDAAKQLAARLTPGSSYVAILAYATPAPPLEAALGRLRSALISRFKVTTTSGYGPRYLHSTGQLHKGGPPTGVFIQLIDRMKPDLAVPGKPYSFGILALAQAAGDFESLRAHDRFAIRMSLGRDGAAAIKTLAQALAARKSSPRRVGSPARRRSRSRRS